MKTPPNVSEVNMPRLIPTLSAGFNTVATNIHLILIPVIVDIVLWLGPKLKITSVAQPLVDYFRANMQALTTIESEEQVTQSITQIQQFISQFNLGVFIRTVPVGIPSLLARLTTVSSPLGDSSIYEVSTTGYAFLAVIILMLVGYLLGTIYFSSLSRFTVTPVLPVNLSKIFRQFGENLVTALILLAMFVMVAVPIMMVISLATMFSAGVGQFLLIVAMFLLLWMAVPLIFAPHGIFVLNQKAYPSMMLSIRMVRFFLPGAGTYVMISAIISEGFNLIWKLPDAASWMTLVSIFGHAFIVTALLAASFIYYRGGLRWMQESLQSITDPEIKAKLGGPFGTGK